MRTLVRRLALVGVAILYLLSVPWYRSGDVPVGITAGLPDWVAVALFCYVGVAILNGVAWLLTDVPDEDPDAP